VAILPQAAWIIMFMIAKRAFFGIMASTRQYLVGTQWFSFYQQQRQMGHSMLINGMQWAFHKWKRTPAVSNSVDVV